MADDLKSPLLGSFGSSNGHPPPAQVGVEHGHIISRGVSPRGQNDSPQGFHNQADLTGAEYSSGDGGSPRPEYFGNVGVQTEDLKEVPDLENGECEVKVTTGPASVGPIIESLDYEINENQIYKEHRDRVAGYRWQYVLLKWLFAFIIGLGTALTAFAINLGVENAAGAKFILLFKFMREGRVWLSFVVYTLVNFGLVLTSSLLVAYVAPAAAGSGIPEVKSYLNGNDIPEILSLRTLGTKIVGSVGSVGGGLAVGKEGPLVHTGAGIAALLGQGGSTKWGMTWGWLRLFKNDRDRRDLVTCGAAAGVAAAFRAPIGGVLFAMEEAASWLSSHLLWRVFFTTAVVSVTIKAAMGWCSKPGACGLFGAGGFILFSEPTARHGYTFFELLPTAVIGVTGGLLGALFNTLNCKVTKWRRNTLAPRGKRYQVAEAAVVSLLTSIVGFSFALLGYCKACPDPETHPNVTCPRRSGHFGNFVNFNCASQTGEYNPLATLFLSTNDDAIRNLFSTNTPLEYPPRSLLLFFVAFYCLAIITYGVAVPSGLFVPAILSGATYGRLMGVMLTRHFGPEMVDEGRYALIGAASFLGGSMRMTVSLCVILLELTDQLSLLPLVMFVLLISKSVGDKFTKGIYDAHILLKKVPFLEEKPEHYMRNITAYQAASKKLVTLSRVEKVRRIMQVLSSCHHNSFPVIDRAEGAEEHFSGLILRHTLLVLLTGKQDFQRSPKIRRLDTVMGTIHGGRVGAGAGGPTHDTYNDFAKPGSGKMLRVQDVALTEDEMEHYIDLAPFLNPAPFVVQEHMSLTKVYNLFRQLGRRHLAVIPAPQQIVGIITRKDLLPERLEALFPEAVHHHHLQ